MTDIAYRPRSVSEIVDASVLLFRRSYGVLVGITAIGYVPWMAAATLVRRFWGDPFTVGPDAMGPSLVSGVIMALGILWFSVVTAGCIAAASDAYLGLSPEIGSSIRRAIARAWPIIGTSFVTYLAVAFGLVLLLVGALYFFAKFVLSSTIALLEERSVGQALSRAAGLSRDRKLHILGSLGAAWLIYAAVAMTVGVLIDFLGAPGWSTIGEALITIGLSPLIGVASAVLYYDLRIRTEGYDVELLERRLRTESGSA